MTDTSEYTIRNRGTVGATLDGGANWTTTYTYTTSANMTTAADITVAPQSGQYLVITDILVSTDTATLFSFVEETSATVVGALRLAADGAAQITPRGSWKLPVADKKLQGKAADAGNIYITVFYHSEP